MPVECNIDFILNAVEDSHFWPQQNSLAQAYSHTYDKYKSWRNYLKKNWLRASENNKDSKG